ncbi:spinster family MFS transporter [Woodsholea maritima]|uniref:spinster family MFS transporter n=1 Tax=Woodsholea maritima TaxID=240237 RepID=UPI00036E7FBF|nr:MFS transporter [Woodsholea maritima]
MTDTHLRAQPSVPGTPQQGGLYRTFVLFMLIVVYTFNFIDRQIIGILSIPIQEELGVTDAQLGLMRGVAFAIFYSILGVPIALLADRFNRVTIMSVALGLWSLMTAVCGVVTTPVQLFFARMGVGVGEAGGVAPAYSIVTDYYPPEKRARALATYSFGIPIGSAIGIVFGAVISQILDWRAAFMIVGALGLVLAPIFRLTVREPKRGQYDSATAKTEPAKISEVFGVLVKKPSFWLLSLGASFSSMMGYGLFAWLPAFFVRSYTPELDAMFGGLPELLRPNGGSPVLYAGYFYGSIVLIGGLIGIWLGGFLADLLGKSDKAMYARVPAIAFIATAPLFVLGVLSPNLSLSFVLFLFPTALSLAWLGPLLSAFQHIVPPNMRVTASAIFLLINNLVGIGAGDYILGFISESLKEGYGAESLRYSILSGTSFYIIAAVILLFAAPFLRKDWEK